MRGYWERGPFPRSDTWYGPYGARPGVERPDEEIRADILRSLESDPWVDPSGINVRVEQGVVTLSGEVDSAIAKRAAEDDAWNKPGVVDVHNNLQIRSEHVEPL